MKFGGNAGSRGRRSRLASHLTAMAGNANGPTAVIGIGRRRSLATVRALIVILLGAAISNSAGAQEVANFFRQNCMSCHTIGGGRLNGPDLKDVRKRQARDWLIRFILDPEGVLASGDPYAANLKKEAGGQKMTKVVGITKELADALLTMIKIESAKVRSQFAGMEVSMEPYTQTDIDAGHRLFMGGESLEKGGTACYSCHAVRGSGWPSGGRLGPDLTKIFERLEGRRNLAAWLSAPPTSTMQPLFKDKQLTPEEINSLIAFFEDSANKGGQEGMQGPLGFLIVGLGFALAGLLLMDFLWKDRFRAVRSLLVRGPREQGETVS